MNGFCAKPIFMSELRDVLAGRQRAGAEGADDSGASIRTGGADTLLVDTCAPGKRVLLVEDNALNQEIVAEILGQMGCAVDVASGVDEALRIMEKAAPGQNDLVLMDVQMPHMDGYEATRQIRCLPDPAVAGVPIVAMTANAFDEGRRDALAAGMDGHLAKPIEVEKLAEVLRSCGEWAAGTR